MAWVPYLLLVVFVLVWGERQIKPAINRLATDIPAALPTIGRCTPWHGGDTADGAGTAQSDHARSRRWWPKPAPYAALYELNWLSASGTACFLAILATALVLRVRPRRSSRPTWTRSSS